MQDLAGIINPLTNPSERNPKFVRARDFFIARKAAGAFNLRSLTI
jgi:hypothetical protein